MPSADLAAEVVRLTSSQSSPYVVVDTGNPPAVFGAASLCHLTFPLFLVRVLPWLAQQKFSSFQRQGKRHTGIQLKGLQAADCEAATGLADAILRGEGVPWMSDPRQHVHELIDRLPPAQLAAVAGLLETIVEPDPVVRAAAMAPPDDEPVTEEDRRRFRQGQAWFAQQGKGIPMEDVLAEFGLKPEDFPRGR